jgi:hypothetical protein
MSARASFKREMSVVGDRASIASVAWRCPGADDLVGDAMKADAGIRARHGTDFESVAVVTDES